MKTIEQLKEKKQKEEKRAVQCREAAKKHEANAKCIQDEILYRQGVEYAKIFNGINLEEEQFKAAKDILFSDKDSFLKALDFLKEQKKIQEEGEIPLYE